MDESTPWDTIPASVINSNKHQKLALEMARKSIVLLENDNNILPLKKGQTIARVLDPLDAEVKEELVAPVSGLVFFAHNEPFTYADTAVIKLIVKEE